MFLPGVDPGFQVRGGGGVKLGVLGSQGPLVGPGQSPGQGSRGALRPPEGPAF